LDINVLIIGSSHLQVLSEAGGQLRRMKVKRCAVHDEKNPSVHW